MNALVTGATGFIGRALIKRLLVEGHEVNYLARQRSRKVDMRAAFHFWQPGERPPLNSVPRLDAMVHLAGEPIAQRWNPEVKQRLRDSRIGSTRMLVDALSELRHRPKVLISASAVGYYGNRGDEQLTEDSSAGNDFLAALCVEWEKEALRARDLGIRVVPIRIAAVLGKGGGALQSMVTPFRLGLGGKFGSGRQWAPWIHLDDLIRLILFAAQSEVDGPVNGGSPGLISNAQFTRALGTALHRPAIFHIPRLALRAALGEMADFLFASMRVIPLKAQQAGFHFEYPEIGQALKAIFG